MRPGLLKTIPEIDFNKALVEFISDMMNRQFLINLKSMQVNIQAALK